MDALFHLAFPVHDLEAARAFYGGVLGCPEGRSSDIWVDFDLFGHQIVAHLQPGRAGVRGTNPVDARDGGAGVETSNPVDGRDVPVPHFGVILSMEEFGRLAERVRGAGVPFVIEPYVRFKGEPGEQATMFFLDPSGNALEFKAFADRSRVFAK
jgi:extradiol dioxygenase family protein